VDCLRQLSHATKHRPPQHTMLMSQAFSHPRCDPFDTVAATHHAGGWCCCCVSISCACSLLRCKVRVITNAGCLGVTGGLAAPGWQAARRGVCRGRLAGTAGTRSERGGGRERGVARVKYSKGAVRVAPATAALCAAEQQCVSHSTLQREPFTRVQRQLGLHLHKQQHRRARCAAA
jgi:hypothetical protein